MWKWDAARLSSFQLALHTEGARNLRIRFYFNQIMTGEINDSFLFEEMAMLVRAKTWRHELWTEKSRSRRHPPENSLHTTKSLSDMSWPINTEQTPMLKVMSSGNRTVYSSKVSASVRYRVNTKIWSCSAIVCIENGSEPWMVTAVGTHMYMHLLLDCTNLTIFKRPLIHLSPFVRGPQ